MSDIYGTGEPIRVGSQVVVRGHGMGTVTSVGCPVFGAEAGPAYHVRIEGDREAICFPADHVTLYADVYAAASRCGVCGEPLRGDLAEVVVAGTGDHLVVHEPCFDRETMELA